MMLSEDFGPTPEFDFNDSTVYGGFKKIVEIYPHEPALVSSWQPADLYASTKGSLEHGANRKDCLRWTFSELNAQVDQLAASLYRHGMRKGMAFATFALNSAEWLTTFLAVSKLACVFVPLNPRDIQNAETVAHMLKTSGVRGLIVQNADVAQKLDVILASSGQDMILKGVIEAVASLGSDWLEFSEFMTSPPDSESVKGVAQIENLPEDPFVVVYTSGTTSLPKACLHANRGFCYNCITFDAAGKQFGRTISCIVAPNNHMLGMFLFCLQLFTGGLMVFPGPVFAPGQTLQVMEDEKVTDLAGVPTMLFAMMFAVRTGKAPRPSAWQRLTVGGAAVTADLLKQCKEELGIKYFRAGYGMSEGSGVRNWYHKDPDEMKRAHTVYVGRIMPGGGVRICPPNSQTPVPRGQPGELHQSHPGMMLGYIGKDRSPDWYSDDKGEWFRTGDQAIMEESGLITISGRYKEIIIRGGENISPAPIEAVLNKTAGIEAIVVPCPDDVAGEVPIAVVKSVVNYSVRDMQDAVLKALGTICVPEAIYSLAELELGDDFPRTMTGKVMKTKVAEVARKHRAATHGSLDDEQTNGHVNGTNGVNGASHSPSTKSVMLGIWSRLLGVQESEIDLDTPINNFADSISVMRALDSFSKQTGKKMSIEDLSDNPTISAQIKFAGSLPTAGVGGATKKQHQRSGPPKAHDMVHLSGDPAEEQKTRVAVEAAIRKVGLTWEDVDTVSPAYDSAQLMFKKRRERSWVMREMCMTRVSSVERAKDALEQALRRSPLLHGFFVHIDQGTPDELALYVTIRPPPGYYGKIITERTPVETEAEFRSIDLLDPAVDYASYPGPLMHWEVVYVKESNAVGLIRHMNHCVLDALAIGRFVEDLEKFLDNPSAQVPYHDDYSLWSDATFLSRYTPKAVAATDFHFKRLSGLRSKEKSFFPAKRTPEWFYGGPNAGWKPSEKDLEAFENPYHKNLNKTMRSDDVNFEEFLITDLPDLPALRTKMPQLTGPVIVKAALALLNIHHTKQSLAIFTSLEANRSTLPFISPLLRTRLDMDPSDMVGAMYTRLIDVIDVRAGESVLEFLARLQGLQKQITQTAAAPMREVYKKLEAEDPGTGALMVDIMQRQFLNWIPGLTQLLSGKDKPQVMRRVKTSFMSDEGIEWAAGIGGPNESTCFIAVLWDDGNTRTEEVMLYRDQLGKLVAWIADKRNWEVEVGGYEACLL